MNRTHELFCAYYQLNVTLNDFQRERRRGVRGKEGIVRDWTIRGMGPVVKILILREFFISRLCRFISYCDNINGEFCCN